MSERTLPALAALGLMLCAVVACQPQAVSPETDGPASPTPPVAKAASLEAATTVPPTAASEDVSPRAAAPSEPLASVDDLLALVDGSEGQPLSEAIERLLLAGKEGRNVILELALRCEKDDDRGRIVAGHPSVTFGIARVVHLYPAEALELAILMLEKVAPDASSLLWGQVLGYLPGFLAYHEGQFANERAKLESIVLSELPLARGQTLYRLFSAAIRLGIEPPADLLIPLLDADQDFANHQAIITHLMARGRVEIQALVDWLDARTNFQGTTPRSAIEMLGTSEDLAARQLVQRYLSHKSALVREAATRAYFRKPRGIDALPIALDLLNSPTIPVRRKRFFLTVLRRKAPEVLEAIRSTPNAVFNPEVRALVDSVPPARNTVEPAPDGPGSTVPKPDPAPVEKAPERT